jgi:hypothetical protein
MLRLLLVALFVLFHVSAGSANLIPNQCLDPKSLRNILTTQIRDVEIASLAGVEAAFFVMRFNTIPPVSQIASDSVLIIGMHKSAQVALAFFKDGCMVSRGVMPRAQAEDILLQLERSGA